MRPQPAPPQTSNANDWPLYWFSKLEKAADDGEFDEAAECVRQLRRLGVDVKYRRPGSRRTLAHV